MICHPHQFLDFVDGFLQIEKARWTGLCNDELLEGWPVAWSDLWSTNLCSCLENPRDGGAWWAAVYGVTQSRTRLKWIRSSSKLPIKNQHLRRDSVLPCRGHRFNHWSGTKILNSMWCRTPQQLRIPRWPLDHTCPVHRPWASGEQAWGCKGKGLSPHSGCLHLPSSWPGSLSLPCLPVTSMWL